MKKLNENRLLELCGLNNSRTVFELNSSKTRNISTCNKRSYIRSKPIPCPSFILKRNKELRLHKEILVVHDSIRTFTNNPIRAMINANSDKSKDKELNELDDKITSSNNEFNSCRSNILLTMLSRENVLSKICSEKVPDLLPILEEVKQDALSKYDSKNREIDALNRNDPRAEIREADLELEKREIMENRTSLVEGMIPDSLFTSHQRQQYRLLSQDSQRLNESYISIAEAHKANIEAYAKALEEYNSSGPSSPPASPGSPPASPGSPPASPASDSEGEKSSLLDDYADPNSEQPSYMDPED